MPPPQAISSAKSSASHVAGAAAGHLDQQLGIPTYSRPGGGSAAAAEQLARTEWLLTNGLGGYAMGTAAGIPTRRYHALLVAAVTPPVQREVMLSSLAETLVVEPGTDRERSYSLASYRFRGGTAHKGHEHLLRFEKGLQARWTYRVAGASAGAPGGGAAVGAGGAGDIEVAKTVHLFRNRNAVAIRYTIARTDTPCRLLLRPLVAMRDSHGLTSSRWGWNDFHVDPGERRARVSRGTLALEMAADSGWFEHDQNWWYGFEYEQEQARGYDCHEDLFSPGVFTFRTLPGQENQVTITVWYGQPPGELEDDLRDNRLRLGQLMQRSMARLAATPAGSFWIGTAAPGAGGGQPPAPAVSPLRQALRKLVVASDDFLVRRGTGSGAGTSIIAGYPWFSDWGRDSMISLPGLLLATRRFEEARTLLETFARYRRNGLIPNVFDDRTGEAWYNTVDASLWFLNAACEYLRVTADRPGFNEQIRSACLDIIDHYTRGTEFGIGMDEADGLIAAGNPDSQLTWMDAKRDGVVFTPRHGKPVEVNALWYSGLLRIAEAIRADDPRRAQELRLMAERTGRSFAARFWNAELGCCHDVLAPGPDGSFKPISQVRPNQVFAVSLPHSPLSPQQQQGVLKIVRARLLTPHGLRTLDPADPAYKGRFRGTMFERDGAYHNGTVWPWLIGPYAEAVLRADGFSPAAREEALAALEPIILSLEDGALGHIPEVYDGDATAAEPQSPGGCIAQAWSIAEVLRVLMMLAA